MKLQNKSAALSGKKDLNWHSNRDQGVLTEFTRHFSMLDSNYLHFHVASSVLLLLS